MTNGEKIKEIFPSTDSRLDEKTGIILVKWVDGATKCFKADWWNAEYKEPTPKNDLGVDCISRQEVLRLLMNSIGKTNTYLQTKVLKMSSVIPIRPKGHWIPTYGNVKCSVCGSVKDSREVGKATHYCDFCGAKMESEEV